MKKFFVTAVFALSVILLQMPQAAAQDVLVRIRAVARRIL